MIKSRGQGLVLPLAMARCFRLCRGPVPDRLEDPSISWASRPIGGSRTPLVRSLAKGRGFEPPTLPTDCSELSRFNGRLMAWVSCGFLVAPLEVEWGQAAQCHSSVAKKLCAMALSKQSPSDCIGDASIGGRRHAPLAAAFTEGERGVLAALVGVMDDRGRVSLPHRHIQCVEHQASSRSERNQASLRSKRNFPSVRRWSAIAHPTTRRLNTSSTTTRYSEPLPRPGVK